MAADDSINSLGFVEVRGLAAAIETADAMLKCAQVRLLRQLLRDPMQTTITVEGTLGACRAAVDAGQAAAMRMDAFVAGQVLGRPARDTADFVLRLAEAGRAAFGQLGPTRKATPATAAAPPSASPSASSSAPTPAVAPDEDDELVAALVAVPGGANAQRLARHFGKTTAAMRERLDALCARGRLVKRGARYLLAKSGGDEK